MQSLISWEELGIADYHDRRLEPRIALSMPIEVTGFDVEGRFFTEITRTIDVSKSGCGFSLKRRVRRGGILAIKFLREDGKQSAGHKPLLYQVARCTTEMLGGRVGAAKLQGESLWSVAFPESESVVAGIS